MSKLSLDRDKVDYAKRLAEQIVNPVQHFIDRHTTDSIERSVLRLMGVSGPAETSKADAAQGRLPLVNALADALGGEKLARGAGYWLGLAAAHHPNQNASQLAHDILSGKINLDQLASKSKDEINRACGRLLQPQLDRLRKNREQKNRRPAWAHPSQPLRYVIVATGNIHEDLRQAKAAVQMGADIIAVIRSTAQSLLDYVPEGATTEGYGGTYATQENFRLMRSALDEMEKKLKRRVGLCNYSSGLCMSEIAVIGALEGVDYLLNDAMYGILFRDINMQRNFVDQFFSRRICALSGITIQTGEDNYLTTAESFKYWFQVLSSHFINHAFAKRAGISETGLALGHAFEMDPGIEDSILYEWAQAQLVRELFPRAPIKFMPPTKHKTGDIFFSYLYDGMFNLAGAVTGQTIQLLGMHTEAIHNPYIQDRFLSLKNANYVFNAAKNAKDEIYFQPNGKVARRARQVLDDGIRLLKKVRMRGMFRSIEEGAFANVRRSQRSGKGMEGVFHKDREYFTPLQNYLTPRAFRDEREGRSTDGRERRRSNQDSRRAGRLGDRKSSRSRQDRSRSGMRDKRPSRVRSAKPESAKAPPQEKRHREPPPAGNGRNASAPPPEIRGRPPQEKPEKQEKQARNGNRGNGAKKPRGAEAQRNKAKPRHAEMSEAELQRMFHEQMKDDFTEDRSKSRFPRRKLEVEKPEVTDDPEATQKVLSESQPSKSPVAEDSKPIPRRPLPGDAAPKPLPRRELKVESAPVTSAAPVQEKAEPTQNFQPLPRRKLKIEPEKPESTPGEAAETSKDEESGS